MIPRVGLCTVLAIWVQRRHRQSLIAAIVSEVAKVEKVRLEQKEHQFLNESDNSLYFMDQMTFEQIVLPTDIIADRRPFLVEGMIVQIEYFEDEPLSVTLPEKVICKIKETEPTVKGQTASNSFKPATLENGFRISVPPFIQQDEEIVVSTQTLEYVERA